MIQIFLGGAIATSIMTLFSYTVSVIMHSQFREPQLLNELITRSRALPFKPGNSNWAGWVIHYLIGILFAAIFDIIWNSTILEPSLTTGALLGFIFGFIGIIGWKIMFSLNPEPPTIDFKKFYIQLIAAHVIFGIGAVIIYL